VCYNDFMVKRLMLTAFLLISLLVGAVRVPASVCTISSAPIGKACRPGCCANQGCCAESQKNHSLPSQPLSKASGANHELTAVVVSNLVTPVIPVHFFELTRASSATCPDRPGPRLAFLCTFLI
jgi:hypothetical protein